MDFKTNFNDQVKVKLTSYGKQLLKDQREELNRYILSRGGKGVGPYVEKVDSDGYTRFQIWDLMQRLGPYMTIGNPEPIEGDMIFIDGEPIEK
ncbi:hypothetical protein QVE09_09520 [Paenibacillus sp. ClWae2A]|uniref:hypothetical protein n=1 Tax=Paenibacillus sp. ClWae2A TaxID=3057177 RepID=UPI0028F61DE7|nr:hypothetical protein [Paenibacillus sp. ClWae2A]MDT9719140.1 hypothetical protein [Paenibacillus sp. ClWae2A]